MDHHDWFKICLLPKAGARLPVLELTNVQWQTNSLLLERRWDSCVSAPHSVCHTWWWAIGRAVTTGHHGCQQQEGHCLHRQKPTTKLKVRLLFVVTLLQQVQTMSVINYLPHENLSLL